ncbi:hypothetical protein PET01_14030 [Pediococcus ethanolidurans]|nr:hypothetical protein PET01_14030 [Pediococcus ethanolidurans]
MPITNGFKSNNISPKNTREITSVEKRCNFSFPFGETNKLKLRKETQSINSACSICNEGVRTIKVKIIPNTATKNGTNT